MSASVLQLHELHELSDVLREINFSILSNCQEYDRAGVFPVKEFQTEFRLFEKTKEEFVCMIVFASI